MSKDNQDGQEANPKFESPKKEIREIQIEKQIELSRDEMIIENNNIEKQ